MGVDLATYRAKIGTFRHSFGVDVVSVDCYVNFTGGLKTVGSVLFIGILLLIAGIESNPGPPKKQVKDVLETKPTQIKISRLPLNVDTKTLVKIFENITGQADGAVKEIKMNVEDQSSMIKFENSKVVEMIIQNQPILVSGTEVDICAYSGDNTEINSATDVNVAEPPEISEVSHYMAAFDSSVIKADRPVQSTIYTRQSNTAMENITEPKGGDNTDIIYFTTANMGEQPEKAEISIHVATYDNGEIKTGGPVQSAIRNKKTNTLSEAFDDTAGTNYEEEPETCSPTKIKVTELPENVDEDMLEMFFENTKKQGGGKVKSVNLNKQKKMAVIDFEEPEAVCNVLEKQPIILCGTKVGVVVHSKEESENPNSTKIKVSGIPDKVDEDMLEMFFENTKKQGGGKVKSVILHKKKKMAIIDFEENKSALNVLKKQPIILFGAEVCISIYDEEEPESRNQTKIKVTGIPENVDEDMLEMFFENTKKQGGGKVKSVNLNKQKKMAVIDFEEPEGTRL